MVDFSRLNQIFGARISAAIRDAEKATGEKANPREGYRDVTTQAKYYRAYKAGTGPIAAPPGQSLHQLGMALDLGPGKVRDWIQAHAKEYGLEAGTRYDRAHGIWSHDPPHVQLARGVLKTPYDATPIAYSGGAPKTRAVQAATDVAAGQLPTVPGGPPVLRKGDTDAKTGGAVTRLQQQLADRGFDLGKHGVDGVFAKDTAAAVRAAEKSYNLPTRDRGVAGPQVQAALAYPREIALPRLRPPGGPGGPGAGLSAGMGPGGVLSPFPPTNVGAGDMPGAGALPSGFSGDLPAPGIPPEPRIAQLNALPADRNRFDTEAMAGGRTPFPGGPPVPVDLAGSLTAGGGVPGASATMPLAMMPQDPGGYPAAWGGQPPPPAGPPGGQFIGGNGVPGGPGLPSAPGYDTRGVSAGLSSPNVGAASSLMQQVAARQAAVPQGFTPPPVSRYGTTDYFPESVSSADYTTGVPGRTGNAPAGINNFGDIADAWRRIGGDVAGLFGGPPTSTAVPTPTTTPSRAIPPAVPESALPAPSTYNRWGRQISGSSPLTFSGRGSTDVLQGGASTDAVVPSFSGGFSPGLTDASTLLPGGAQFQASGAELPAAGDEAYTSEPRVPVNPGRPAPSGIPGYVGFKRYGPFAVPTPAPKPSTATRIGMGVAGAAANAAVPGLGLLFSLMGNRVSGGSFDQTTPYRGQITTAQPYAAAAPNPYGGYSTGSSYSASPFTPAGSGWHAPSFSQGSGGPLYSYNTETHQYVDSKGNVHSY